MKISIHNKEYNVKEVYNEEEKRKGLLGVKKLPEDEGMLFFFDPPEVVEFYMKDTLIPLDIIYIDEDLEVVKVTTRKPNDETLESSDKEVMYVLEVNANSGIEVNDELDFIEEKIPVMKVLALDGSIQMELFGGERIFRRPFTKQLIRLAKLSKTLKNEDLESLYKRVGRKMFKEIKALDTRKPEYVQKKD